MAYYGVILMKIALSAAVVVNLRMSSLEEGVSFDSSSYNFTLFENGPEGAVMGTVTAYPGNDLHTVNYMLVTHTDTFSIYSHGGIVANKAMDKESQEWYILEVEVVTTESPLHQPTQWYVPFNFFDIIQKNTCPHRPGWSVEH